MEAFCPKCERRRAMYRRTQQETYVVNTVSVTIPVTAFCCVQCDEEAGTTPKEEQTIMDRIYDKYEEMTGLSADRPT